MINIYVENEAVILHMFIIEKVEVVLSTIYLRV
jgi:hypothetical protein